MRGTSRQHQPLAVELPPPGDAALAIGERAMNHVVALTGAVCALAFVLGTMAVSTLTVAITVDGTGSLEPMKIWPVRSLENGTIASVFVKTGDTVRAGQPLMRLDSLSLTGDLAEARAQYAEQELEVRKLAKSAPLQRQNQAEARFLANAHLIRARAALLGDMIEYSLGTNVDSLILHYVSGRYVALDIAAADVLSAQF